MCRYVCTSEVSMCVWTHVQVRVHIWDDSGRDTMRRCMCTSGVVQGGTQMCRCMSTSGMVQGGFLGEETQK